MQTMTHKVSPYTFGKIKEFLMHAECAGNSPDAAAYMALVQFGFPPIYGVEHRFEIDWNVNGEKGDNK